MERLKSSTLMWVGCVLMGAYAAWMYYRAADAEARFAYAIVVVAAAVFPAVGGWWTSRRRRSAARLSAATRRQRTHPSQQ